MFDQPAIAEERQQRKSLAWWENSKSNYSASPNSKSITDARSEQIVQRRILSYLQQPEIRLAVVSPAPVIQRVVNKGDGQRGDIVVDTEGEMFKLYRWSNSKQGWEVDRIDTSGDKRRATFRRADELDLVSETTSTSVAGDSEAKRSKATAKSAAPDEEEQVALQKPEEESDGFKRKREKKQKKKRTAQSMLSFADDDEWKEGDSEEHIGMKSIYDVEGVKPKGKKKDKRKRKKKIGEYGITSSADYQKDDDVASTSTGVSGKMKEEVPPIQFPTGHEIASNGDVKAKMEKDLKFSIGLEQEFGGYIYWNPLTQEYNIINAARGESAFIDLSSPPAGPEGYFLVANYHTHPDLEGYQKPSPGDVQLSSARGIPSIVIAASGELFISGPDRRREEQHERKGGPQDYPIMDPNGGYEEEQPVRFGDHARSVVIPK